MANLVIDIGNTFTKVAVFENDDLLTINQTKQLTAESIDNLLYEHVITKVITSSVKKEKQSWQIELEKKHPVIYFNSLIPAGVNNYYKTPDTLGTDRFAAVIGAHYLYPQQNNIIISGGTCITYDYIDSNANYLGGSISPGLNMRFNALNHYTDALPLIIADAAFTAIYGNDTTSAIISGVQNGIKYELKGFIESYTKAAEQYNIILSGGDGIFFDTLLKNSIFAPYIKNEPHLVLKGLNAAIQQHND
ncbi:type III pantothenate kinase [Mucilaginibacter segetis]|uniref:Type III pantothenate kinase n=1 Tax=Mucilaginibacter segetis TaxID=2793071 RepID=A0A934UL00_9SPHI|nr:type III pantothenate kinase [Mucilaginibacter segetis]MBK0378008.1 type III pantothenate kinase [Mucilaginibacter segetis]